MSFLENCFNTMLEYGEAIKSSFVKGHVSDWSEEKEEFPVSAFKINASYLVNNKTSYNKLPKSYRDAYGEWGTEGLEASLPWLAVEFDSTPAKELQITVTGPDFKKEISYPDVDKNVTLLTLNAEELGTELIAGDWTVTVNGTTTTIVVK